MASDAPLAPGTLVDHFRVMRQIGRGGMGEVYLARDTQLGRKVALKLLRPHRNNSPHRRQRFLFEARATARFNHPHIIAIYAVGEVRSRMYVALEYLEGETLQQRMRQGRLGLKESLRIALAVAQALMEAHQRELLHRDLKPANVFLPKDGRLRVLDFGLAMELSESESTELMFLAEPGAQEPPPQEPPPQEPPPHSEPSGPTDKEPPTDWLTLSKSDQTALPREPQGLLDATLGLENRASDTDLLHEPTRSAAPAQGPHPESTEAGPLQAGPLQAGPRKAGPLQAGPQGAPHAPLEAKARPIEGTPAYMAPEQWLRQSNTTATDVWALGVVLYEMLAGQRPYGREPIKSLFQKVTSPAAVPMVEALDGLSMEIRTLLQRCLAKDPRERIGLEDFVEIVEGFLSPQPSAGWAEQNPFRGLMPFREGHSGFFFGRQEERNRSLERLRESVILPIIGPSGVGKSSFVQAGLIPRLREQGEWSVLQLRPGSQPFVHLALRLLQGEGTDSSSSSDTWPAADLALEGPSEITGQAAKLAAQLFDAPEQLPHLLRERAQEQGRRILLFVDQLEELYTHVEDLEGQRRFLEAICSSALDPQDPVRVVFTLRDDFLGRLRGGKEVREALSQVMVLWTPQPEALRETVEGPMRLLRYQFDRPGLLDEMVQSVAGEPACLPLLQFAMRALWERRDAQSKRLLSSVYAAMGGVEGALAGHADRLLEGLSSAQLRAARELMLRFVTAEGTRQVLSMSRAIDGLGEEGQEVLERMIQGRLVTIRKERAAIESEAEVELAHESLLSHWKQMGRWLEESREERGFYQQLQQAAELWKSRGYLPEEVWQGEALGEAQRILDRGTMKPSDLARQFLRAGRGEQLRKERRKRRWWAVGIGSLLALTLASWWVALGFQASERREAELRRRAVQQQKRAERQRQLAQIRLAQALLEEARGARRQGRALKARALLRSALELRDAPGARILWSRLQRDPILWAASLPGAIHGFSLSPTGRQLAIANSSQALVVLDLETIALKRLRGHGAQVVSTAFSGSGRWLASGDQRGRVLLWDLRSHRSQLVQRHASAVWGLAWRPDGRVLASSSDDGSLCFWDVHRRRSTGCRPLAKERLTRLRYAPDGSRLAISGGKDAIRLWSRGVVVAKWSGHSGRIRAIEWSPDGRWFASAGTDGVLLLRDAHSGRIAQRIPTGQSAVTALAFHPQKTVLAWGGVDKVVRVWDWKKKALIRKLRRARVNITALAFRGSVLLFGGWGSRVWAWRWEKTPPLAPPRLHLKSINGLSIDPSGRWMAVASWDHPVQLLGLSPFRRRRYLHGARSTTGVDFHPTKPWLAASTWKGKVLLWDFNSGEKLRSLPNPSGLYGVRFHPRGRALAAFGRDWKIRLWDVDSGALLHTLQGHRGRVYAVDFDPSGKWMASASKDQEIWIWDWQRGARHRVLKGHRGPVKAVAFDRRSSHLLWSGGRDKTLRQWDLKTQKHRILGRHDGEILKLALDPKGRWIATAGADRQVRLWSRSGPGSARFRKHRRAVDALAFHPKGRWLYSASNGDTAWKWDLKHQRPAWRAPFYRPSDRLLYSHRGWHHLTGHRARRHTPKARWQEAVERALGGALSADESSLCLTSRRAGRRELSVWDLRRDRKLRSWPLRSPVTTLYALQKGCLLVAGGRALRYLRHGAIEPLQAAGRWSFLRVDKASHLPTASMFAAQGGTWIGHADGSVERLGSTRSFKQTQSARVMALAEGPMKTLFVGYANGAIELWHRPTRSRVRYLARLNGRIRHLHYSTGWLYGVSETGDLRAFDLRSFSLDRCALLRRIWRKVPVLWRAHQLVLRPAPQKHPCSP